MIYLVLFALKDVYPAYHQQIGVRRYKSGNTLKYLKKRGLLSFSEFKNEENNLLLRAAICFYLKEEEVFLQENKNWNMPWGASTISQIKTFFF